MPGLVGSPVQVSHRLRGLPSRLVSPHRREAYLVRRSHSRRRPDRRISCGHPLGCPAGREDLPEPDREERPKHLQRAEAGSKAKLFHRVPLDPVLGPERHGKGGECPPRDLAEHGSPGDVPGRTPDQLGNLASVIADREDAAGHYPVDVGPEPGHRRRDPRSVQPKQFGARHLFPVEPLPPGVVELPHGEAFEHELRVDQACVNPEQEVRVQCVVCEASDGIDAVHFLMDQVDPAGGLLCLLSGPESEGERELKRPFHSLPRVAFVKAGLTSSSQDQGMGRLHQEGPGSSEEDGGLSVHLPGGRVRPEKPRSVPIARRPHAFNCSGWATLGRRKSEDHRRRQNVTKVSQLRMYRIAEGRLAEFVQQWLAGVVPLRRKMGFTVDGAWTVRGEDRFVWIVSYEGEESFETKNEEYSASSERKALDPNPADLIEESMELIISPVWSG